MLAYVVFNASRSCLKLTESPSLLQMFKLIRQMLSWIEILRLGKLLQSAEFTVMFMKPFLDISVLVAWGITLLKKSIHSCAAMLLGMHLTSNDILLPCGSNHSSTFIKGPNMCHKDTSHTIMPQPDMWHD